MKYTRLSKEQFEELYQEFANFLAVQNIDKKEWEQIKINKPEVAEQELDVFSDLIWEGALNQAQYLEHFDKSYIFLFCFDKTKAESVIIKSLDNTINFLTQEGMLWLKESILSDKVEIQKGEKKLHNRNAEIFQLIKQGATITNGNLFKSITI